MKLPRSIEFFIPRTDAEKENCRVFFFALVVLGCAAYTLLVNL